MARITPKNVRKFQDGGAAPAPEQAPAQAAPQEAAPQGAPAGGGNPQEQIQQILQMMAQAVQNQDGQLALQACALLLQVLGQAQGGAEQGPAMARKGGVIFRRGSNGRFER